jgi:hypothetical protein
MSNFVLVPFYVKNFTGAVSQLGNTPAALSSYTLPFTEFVFYPDETATLVPGDAPEIYASENTTSTSIITGFSGESIDTFSAFSLDVEAGLPVDYSRKRIVWYFGDGTYSTDLVAKHYYTTPGTYNVTCVFFDASGNTYQNFYSANVTVYNFVPDNFTINLPDSTYYTLTAGRVENPFQIQYTYSWQTVQSLSAVDGVNYKFTSLSATKNYFDQSLENNKFAHLYPYSVFYERRTCDIRLTNILVPTQEGFCRTPVNLYCKLSGANVVYTTEGDVGSVFCGVSGNKNVWYRDSFPQTNSVLYVTPYNKSNGVNILPIAFNVNIVPNESLSALAISSNGITGEGSKDNTFDIDSTKYVNQKVNFVITVKDTDWYTVPLSANFSLGDYKTNSYYVSVFPMSGGQPIHTIGNIVTNFSYVSAVTSGFFKGYFKPTTTASNIYLSAICGLSGVDGFYLDGSSSTFTVYPSSGQYSVSKVNEDFDWTREMKNLRYQEFLENYPVLFDDFFGSIFGNLSSDPLSMGKVPYEKIVNFVSNKFDINTCDVDSLFSMSFELDSNFKQFEKNNFAYPAQLKRLVDLLSINYSRLRGNKNQFNQNLDPNFGADPLKYGINVGSKLDFNTATLTLNTGYIVAYERFSGTYKLCNTYITTISTPIISTSPTTYALSSYNPTWGWGLNLGQSVSGEDITKYYDFFAYNNVVDGTILNGTIDYNNPLNTLTFTNSSYTEWVKDGGIIDGLISNALYTGINLLSS